MSIPISSLPKAMQDQVAAQLWPSVPAKAISVTPKPLIRQKAGPALNKLETAFLGHLRATETGWRILEPQSVTLKLANGVRYTPDFMLIGGVANTPETPPKLWGCLMRAYETKGFMREDAALKLKFAARVHTWIAFHLVTRKKGVWRIDPVLP